MTVHGKFIGCFYRYEVTISGFFIEIQAIDKYQDIRFQAVNFTDVVFNADLNRQGFYPVISFDLRGDVNTYAVIIS